MNGDNLNLFRILFPVGLPVEKSFKLKVYAVLSTHKNIPEEMIAGKMFLSLVCAYDRMRAESAILEGLKLTRPLASPDDYNLTRVLLERNLDQLVDLGSITRPAGPVETKESKIIKGKHEMIAYIRYVFDKAGTPEEKAVGESVIKKYNQIQNA